MLNGMSVVPTDEPPIEVGQRWDRDLADRKLWLLRRSGLFGEDTKGARIERATTLEDLRKAYELVHAVYLGTGYIEPETAGIRVRVFESTPEMATFVARVDDRVVGVLSVIGDSKLGLPSDAAFKKELDRQRSRGKYLCEVTNQAVAPEYRRSAVPTELIRCAVAHGNKADYDLAVAAVSPSHNGFYELMGFREIGGERSYSDKLHDPVVSLSMDVDQYRRPPLPELNETERFIHDFLARKNHFLPLVENWAEEARRRFLNAHLLRKLFVEERNLLSECSEAQRQTLCERWGHELFAAVTGGLFIPSTERLLEKALSSLVQGAPEAVYPGENVTAFSKDTLRRAIPPRDVPPSSAIRTAPTAC